MGKEKMKRYSAKFSCGHVGDIYYYSNEQLLMMLNNAETKGLCPKCKAENFKKNSVLVTMSYKEYKEFYKGKRGVLCGDYNPDTHKIEVYLTKKKAEEHTKRHERFWCECETLCKDEEEKAKKERAEKAKANAAAPKPVPTKKPKAKTEKKKSEKECDNQINLMDLIGGSE